MEKEFIPYELALTLKELGFDEPCLRVGNPHEHTMWKWYEVDADTVTVSIQDVLNVKYSSEWVEIPTYSQAFRWFRDKHNLDKVIDSWSKQPMNDDEIWDKAYQYYINGEAYHPYFKTYEQAELACLDTLIHTLNKKVL